MKITDVMVDKACVAYSNRSAGGITPVVHGDWMRDALEAALTGVEDQERKAYALATALRVAHNVLNDVNLEDGKARDVVQSGIWSVLHAHKLLMAYDALKLDPNRWAGFSDDEVKEIYAGAHDRELRTALPAHNRGVANELANDANDEIRRRRGGYQGPGVYERAGMEYKVIGRVGDDGQIVLQVLNDDVGFLYTETWEDFNLVRQNEPPTYRYLRPLGD